MITLTLILFGLFTVSKLATFAKEVEKGDSSKNAINLTIFATYLGCYIWLINHFIN